MSWTLNFEVSEGQETLEEKDYDHLEGEARGAAEEAATSAINLVLSGCYGDPDTKRFYVHLSGHTNPGHEPVEGWSNDFISVNVSQANDA